MDEHHRAEFVCDLEESVQALVAEFDVADAGADLDAQKTGSAHAPTQLVDGAVWILQCYRAQREEAVRVLADHAREEVVLRGSQICGAVR
jgi:hypothetical protein